MSFIKKLFKTKKLKEDIIDQDVLNSSNLKTSIFDFFEIDLKNIPDNSFIANEIENNKIGQTVQTFRKLLSYKECGLFDTLEIKVIEGIHKNIFFKTFNPDGISFKALKKLIDDLYLIHGNDIDNKGKFNNNDRKDYLDSEFYMLFGRSWTEVPKNKHPITISRDENELTLSIWGIKK